MYRITTRITVAVAASASIACVLAVAASEAVAQATGAAAARSADDRPPTDIAGLKSLEQNIRKAIEKVKPSVVAVSGGTGVVVSEDGLVLTVAHVGVRAGRIVTITFPDGRRVRGKTLGNDHGVDAGMVQIEEPGPWPHVELGISRDLRVGQWCLTLGYPVSFEHGKPPSVRIGRVLRVAQSLIITDCAIMGGDSGGPLIDLEGKVVAIGSRCEDRITTNVHVPIDRYRDVWDRLVKGEDFNSRHPNLAFLGVGPDANGNTARIGSIIPNSAAEKAGLRAGDVIVKFDGDEVTSYEDLPTLIRKRKPGDQVAIEIRRGDETVQIKATLGRRAG